MFYLKKGYTMLSRVSSGNFDNKSEAEYLNSSYTADSDESLLSLRIYRSYHRRLLYLSIGSLCLSIIFFGLSINNMSFGGVHLRNSELRKTSFYSPLFDKIDIPVFTKVVNGTLIPLNPPSIYRQDPSPEVDAAWNRLANTGTIAITSEEVQKLGKDPLKTARYPSDFGLGPDAHVAAIDVFHQIHCLNALRQEINFDYYYGDIFPDGKPNEAHKLHTSHCIHILLQNLMCVSNIDVFTHRWVDVQENPIPDFNINKQCRDFERILQWRDDHIVDHWSFRRPPDVIPEKASAEFVELFNQQQYVHNDVKFVSWLDRDGKEIKSTHNFLEGFVRGHKYNDPKKVNDLD